MTRGPDLKANAAQDGEPVQLALFDDRPGPAMPAKLTAHPLYWVWKAMRARCYNPKTRSFKDYGLRGIVVCDEWRGASRAFVAWAIKAGWQRGLQLDRENNDGPYCPSNCRFVPPVVNANNKRGTHYLRDGRPLRPAIRASGVCEGTVRYRLSKGESPDSALSRPVALNGRRRYLSDGTPLADAIRASGLTQGTVYGRIRRGWTPEQAAGIAPPPQRRHKAAGQAQPASDGRATARNRQARQQARSGPL